VALVATDEHGRNPSRITTLLHSFQSAGDGRPSLGVQATALAGRCAAAQAEVLLGEHMLNDPSLRSWQLSMICLYDIAQLDERAALSMRQCHPTIRDGRNGSAASPDYQPDGAATVLATPLAAPPTDALRITATSGHLGRARAFVRGAAGALRIDPDRVDDLVLAVNEAITNSIRFGGGRAEVAVFPESNAVVCDVRDEGRIPDPLVGRIAPLPGATDGRGMWLVNQLCDLVQIRSGADGTAVRMFVAR
jgi:anti-sigma regulatory factor (Ser/Thr protein kinase)